jgi:hypothetical protein
MAISAQVRKFFRGSIERDPAAFEVHQMRGLGDLDIFNLAGGASARRSRLCSFRPAAQRLSRSGPPMSVAISVRHADGP